MAFKDPRKRAGLPSTSSASRTIKRETVSLKHLWNPLQGEPETKDQKERREGFLRVFSENLSGEARRVLNSGFFLGKDIMRKEWVSEETGKALAEAMNSLIANTNFTRHIKSSVIAINRILSEKKFQPELLMETVKQISKNTRDEHAHKALNSFAKLLGNPHFEPGDLASVVQNLASELKDRGLWSSLNLFDVFLSEPRSKEEIEAFIKLLKNRNFVPHEMAPAFKAMLSDLQGQNLSPFISELGAFLSEPRTTNAFGKKAKRIASNSKGSPSTDGQGS